MENANEAYKSSVGKNLKFKIWELVLNLISLIVMILIIFVPHTEINAQKLFINYMTQMRKISLDDELSQKFEEEAATNSAKLGLSIDFTLAAILDFDYNIEVTDSDDGEEKEEQAPKEIDYDLLEKRAEAKLIKAYLISELVKLLPIGDDAEFMEKVYADSQGLSEYKRNISVYELSLRIFPETGVGNLFKSGTNIFYGDTFGSILITLPWFIVLLGFSVGVNIAHLLSCLICLINIDAATRRYYKRCMGMNREKRTSAWALKNQRTYTIPPYMFAYAFLVVVALLSGVTAIVASNFCSCLPFLSLTVSPLAYALAVIEVIVFFTSLRIVVLKKDLRDYL